MQSLKETQDTRPGLPDLLNWAFPIANGVLICKDGSLLAGYFFEGPDLDSSPDTRLEWVSERVNDALCRLGGGWTAWIDAVRMPAPTYFDPKDSHFPDPISALIEEERRQHFLRAGQHYETEYVITIGYMPPARSKGMLLNLIYDGEEEDDDSPANAILASFERQLMDIEDSLSGVIKYRRMVDFDAVDAFGQSHRRSNLINYLNYLIENEEISLNLQTSGFYLDTVIGRQEFYAGDTPQVGKNFVAVVSVSGYPEASVPGILSVLDVLPIPLRYSSRFIFIDQPEAKKQINSIERKWKQRVRGFWADVLRVQSPRLDSDAVEMVEQANEALARTNSQRAGTGYYSQVVVLMAPTPAEALENARVVQREIRNLGFNTRIESVGATEAWLGSLPGHTVPNVQRPPLHTDNLADMLPLTGVWTGTPTNPCPFYPPGSPALLQAATTGAAPFWLNLHVSDVGHFLVFGPIGSGKSTLLATISLQALRYPGMTIWSFDKGRSLLASTKAVGGSHYEVHPDGDLGFCPLQFLETASDVAWAEEWIATLFELQHGAAPAPFKRTEIHRTIMRMRSSNSGRSLTHFCAEVQDISIREAVHHYTLSGPLGGLLDSESDDLAEASRINFEIEELMGMGERQLIPVLLYLSRRFEKSLRGQPAMLLIDEAWIMLGHPVFREKIREWLKVLRKANCAVGMATQSLSDAVRSGILDVLMEAVPTKIFGANIDAALEGTGDHPGPAAFYRSFGMNEVQIEMIRTAIPKRQYYVTQPNGCRLIDLQLGPVALSFVGAGSKEEITRVNELESQFGSQWPQVWMKERGIAA